MAHIWIAAATALALIVVASTGIAEQTKAPKPCPDGQVRNTNGICVALKGKVDVHDLSITKKPDSSSPR